MRVVGFLILQQNRFARGNGKDVARPAEIESTNSTRKCRLINRGNSFWHPLARGSDRTRLTSYCPEDLLLPRIIPDNVGAIVFVRLPNSNQRAIFYHYKHIFFCKKKKKKSHFIFMTKIKSNFFFNKCF